MRMCVYNSTSVKEVVFSLVFGCLLAVLRRNYSTDSQNLVKMVVHGPWMKPLGFLW